MRAGLAVVTVCSLALALALIGGRTAEGAAPPLQLPWPTVTHHPYGLLPEQLPPK